MPSEKARRNYGRTPWGLDPVFWGLIVFFAGIFIGGILLMIARRSTKRSLQQGQTFTEQAFSPVSSDPGNPYAAPVATSPVSNGRHPGSMDILPGR